MHHNKQIAIILPDMLQSIGLLVFFLIICFIIGIYFLPSFFKKTRKYFNDEMLNSGFLIFDATWIYYHYFQIMR